MRCNDRCGLSAAVEQVGDGAEGLLLSPNANSQSLPGADNGVARGKWSLVAFTGSDDLSRQDAWNGDLSPGRTTLELCLTFSAAGPPRFEELAAQAASRGYRVQRHSLRISFIDSRDTVQT